MRSTKVRTGDEQAPLNKVARQPIFSGDKSIAAYELLFRHSGQASAAQILDGDQATSSVLTDGIALATEGLSRDKKIFINFPKIRP